MPHHGAKRGTKPLAGPNKKLRKKRSRKTRLISANKAAWLLERVGYGENMDELRFKFDSKKTAQAAAFLLKRAGGSTSKGHLIKMLYASDRRQIRRTGLPLTGDKPYSMKNGPILSAVLDLLDGDKPDAFWNKHISTATRDSYSIKLLEELPSDLLSEDEKQTLSKACDFFAPMSWAEVQEYFHNPKIIGEWENPGNSRKEILFERIYQEVGRGPGFADEVRMMQKEEDVIARLLA